MSEYRRLQRMPEQRQPAAKRGIVSDASPVALERAYAHYGARIAFLLGVLRVQGVDGHPWAMSAEGQRLVVNALAALRAERRALERGEFVR